MATKKSAENFEYSETPEERERWNFFEKAKETAKDFKEQYRLLTKKQFKALYNALQMFDNNNDQGSADLLRKAFRIQMDRVRNRKKEMKGKTTTSC